MLNSGVNLNRYKNMKVGCRSPDVFPVDRQLRDVDVLIPGQAQDTAFQGL